MKKTTLVAVILLFSSAISAEYRVYQYYVKSKYSFAIDKKPYLVTSTLDPVSYIAYNGGSDSLEVSLLRTWECMGHTGNLQEYCEAPSEPKEQ